ncbi:MAG: hypothetical protein JW936_01515 [Sedimentisphaerales bacterium]|nr:hypothetical protein [Sedimentisphaerales bacterium]
MNIAMKRTGCLIAVTLSTAALVLAIVWILSLFAPFTVTIINNRPEPINNLLVKYTGGQEQCSRLAPGTEIEFTIEYQGDSHIELECSDEEGITHYYLVDIYLTSSYSGHLDITLENNDTISWNGNIDDRTCSGTALCSAHSPQ